MWRRAPRDILRHGLTLSVLRGSGPTVRIRWSPLPIDSDRSARRIVDIVMTADRDDFTLDQGNRDLNPPATYNDSHQTGYFLGVYAQDEFQVLTNLILNAGVRYDYFRSFGGVF